MALEIPKVISEASYLNGTRHAKKVKWLDGNILSNPPDILKPQFQNWNRWFNVCNCRQSQGISQKALCPEVKSETGSNSSIIGGLTQTKDQHQEFPVLDLSQNNKQLLEVIRPYSSLSKHVEPWPKGRITQPVKERNFKLRFVQPQLPYPPPALWA